LHNIKAKTGREKALKEMLRILKSGQKFAIVDIQHGKAYADYLETAGATVMIRSKPNYSYLPPIITIEGAKQ
jgi:arsenite methyltransferase